MTTSSNNPAVTLLRERVDDLAAYLEQWAGRAAATDRQAMQAAGVMALDRINAIANQLTEVGLQLTAELQAYANPVEHDSKGWPLLKSSGDWSDLGTGPGYGPESQPRYTGRPIPPIEGLDESGDDGGEDQ